MKRFCCSLLLALLFVVCASAGSPDAAQANFSLADLQGQQHKLADYHGKVLVVNFWATWCGPCKHEMPLFSDAEKHYGADRVQVVAVSLDDKTTQNKIPGFAEKEKMSFPILLADTDTMKKLGMGEALPATLFIDGNGQVVARVLGEISKSELHARLDYMLGKSDKEPVALLNNVNKKKADEPMVPMMH
jgi:thiol-disulfide isomerase/thioredoxin